MTWYSVAYLAKSTIAGEENIWEECICLVKADTNTEAEDRAKAIGIQNEHEYDNRAGERVRWSFDSILRVCELTDSEIKDGSEVYSAFLSRKEADQLKEMQKPFKDK